MKYIVAFVVTLLVVYFALFVLATPAAGQEPIRVLNVSSRTQPQADAKTPVAVVTETKVEVTQMPGAAAILATGAKDTANVMNAFTACVKEMAQVTAVKDPFKACQWAIREQKDLTDNLADESSKAARPQIIVPYNPNCIGCIGGYGYSSWSVREPAPIFGRRGNYEPYRPPGR